MRRALPIVLAFAACARDPSPPVITLEPPPSAALVKSAPAKSAPPPSATAPLPKGIAVCEPAGEQYGEWQPTLEEVLAATEALPWGCIHPDERAAAIRACAARLGRAAVKVGAGTLDDPMSCEEAYVPATWNGRRWIALHVSARDHATFTGSGFAAELRAAKAILYVDNTGFLADCNGSGKAPKGVPADWPALPVDLTRLLCGY